ncbi:MAG: hypothetical protein K2X87_23990 [Gemmataceae bacterium]|nr:hypothetical protein [Gemmataceae bacterium]
MNPADPTPAVVLFALEREAAPFRRAVRGRPDVDIVVTGIGHAAAAKAIAGVLAGPRPGLVVMAGFGGALRDGLRVGDVVTPAEVVDDRGGRWACAGGGAGRLLTMSAIAATPAEKRSLGDRFSADVVDMESAAVAEACRAAGVPFRAVRAVSDTVDVGLSPRLAELFAAGRFSPWRAALALVRQPVLIAEFWRLARDTRLAADRLAAELSNLLGERGA